MWFHLLLDGHFAVDFFHTLIPSHLSHSNGLKSRLKYKNHSCNAWKYFVFYFMIVARGWWGWGDGEKGCVNNFLKSNVFFMGWVPVAHACNPSYSWGRAQDGYGSRPAQANSSQELILKISNIKRSYGGAQVVEHLPSKHEVLSSNSCYDCKKKKVFSSITIVLIDHYKILWNSIIYNTVVWS
jgi:hypothetical protein